MPPRFLVRRRCRRSFMPGSLRRVFALTGSLVLALTFAAAPASAKPVTETVATHNCEPLGTDDLVQCIDVTQTTTTNAVGHGDTIVFHVRYSSDILIAVTGTDCNSTTSLHAEGFITAVSSPSKPNGTHHNVDLQHYIVNCGGTSYDCVVSGTWHEDLNGEDPRLVFDHTTETCSSASV